MNKRVIEAIKIFDVARFVNQQQKKETESRDRVKLLFDLSWRLVMNGEMKYSKLEKYYNEQTGHIEQHDSI